MEVVRETQLTLVYPNHVMFSSKTHINLDQANTPQTRFLVWNLVPDLNAYKLSPVRQL